MLTEWARHGVPDMPEAEQETNAVIIGSAACVRDDLSQVPTGWADLIIAVNDAGSYYRSDLHHWCSLHPEKFPVWEALRKAHGNPPGYVKWGRRRPAGVDHGPVDRVCDHWGGSSAGLALYVALNELEVDNVVLCGVPQDKGYHFHTIIPETWEHFDHYWNDWKRLHKDGKLERVRSMSGRTRELLGAPAWLS